MSRSILTITLDVQEQPPSAIYGNYTTKSAGFSVPTYRFVLFLDIESVGKKIKESVSKTMLN